MLALAVGFGLFRLFESDIAVTLENWIRRLRLDPDDRLIHEALTKVANLQPGRRRLIEAGAFFYGTLHLVEGFGLIRGKNWGAFLTIIATSSLIPLELYEIGRDPSALRILVLAVNAAFVAYLISGGCYYAFSGHYAPTLAGFLPRIALYYPRALGTLAGYVGFAFALRAGLHALAHAAHEAGDIAITPGQHGLQLLSQTTR